MLFGMSLGSFLNWVWKLTLTRNQTLIGGMDMGFWICIIPRHSTSIAWANYIQTPTHRILSSDIHELQYRFPNKTIWWIQTSSQHCPKFPFLDCESRYRNTMPSTSFRLSLPRVRNATMAWISACSGRFAVERRLQHRYVLRILFLWWLAGSRKLLRGRVLRLYVSSGGDDIIILWPYRLYVLLRLRYHHSNGCLLIHISNWMWYFVEGSTTARHKCCRKHFS
jgi:hypothetical protein